MQLFLYQAGDSWLHRRSAGAKFLALLLLSIVLFTIEVRAVLLVCFVVAMWALASTGLPLSRWQQALRWPLLAIALLCLLNGLWLGPSHALIVALRLGAVLFLASAVTASTQTSAALGALERILLPLERRGWLHAQKAAFTLSLALTLVPVMFEQLRLAREAQVARGAQRSLRGLFTPVLVRVMKAADELTEAVEARGFPRAVRARASEPAP